MTTNQNNQAGLESHLKEMGEENNQLLLELHRVQEELEQYYLRNEELENAGRSASPGDIALAKGWVDDELPDVLAESHRFQALVETQKKIYQLEAQNSLTAKLGNILIRSVDSPGSLLSVPGKLGKIWWTSSRQTPPRLLGGKGFDKVIAAYNEGGLDAVEKLLVGVVVSPAMRANAYTALARHLASSDRVKAAEAARRAHALDPKPYRLKWLAFKLHDAGDVVEAEAMLDILPPDTSFSDSEARQAGRLRYEAKNARQRDAKQKTGFSESRAAMATKLTNLEKARDAQAKLAAERAREIDGLKKVRAKLEAEKSTLARWQADTVRLAEERARKIDELKQTQARLEAEKSVLAARQAGTASLADERAQEIDGLKQALAWLDAEKSALAERLAETVDLADERAQEIDGLKHAQAQLEVEKSALSEQQVETEKLAEERAQAIDGLKQAQARLETENSALAARQADTAKLADERAREIDALKQMQAKLETDKSALAGWQADTAKLAEERVREIGALKQVQGKLEAEKSALAERQAETAKLAEERAKEIDGLKQAQAKLETEKSALAGRQAEAAKLAEERARKIDELKEAQAKLDAEKSALAGRQAEAAKLAEERARKIDELKQAQTKLENEKSALAARQADTTKLAEEHAKEIDGVKQAHAKLDAEKSALAGRQAEAAKLAEERARKIEELKQAHATLETEKSALAGRQAEATKLAEERARKIDELKQTQTKLETEKSALAGRQAEAAKLAEERARKIDELKQTQTKLEAEKTALRTRNQISARKNKGDDDIDDLIVDLEMFFTGKAIVYVDVGAYVGGVFLKIKRMAKKFRIHEAHLFEPNPVSYEQLLTNLAGSSGSVVHTYNLAVSESNEANQLVKAGSMTKALSNDVQIKNGPSDIFVVDCVGLDAQKSIFTDGKINLLKIDVEGKELDVLASARQLLATQSVDILYIEVGFNVSGTQQTYFAEIDRLLQSFGYRVLRIYEQKEEWMSDSPLLRRANIAYMSEKFANAHPLTLMRELQDLKARLNELMASDSKDKK
ncbi:FkbM family methyltransferase [Paraburkholderia antibiotica]|uniref:FkbM family methyltransferase n=1 Tax=Paraburkholderia antibiotica TaxID=2728839 RepID=A0A7Y0A0P5_9BURK|nr:FkbM family methyltransferase [Paraburkholderia antibiotica]NML34331.1 FkbM family methyltransferase [Paraburkholderia antibiotica]